MRIVISSGHGKYVRGASGVLDEVDEARLVVEDVAHLLRTMGIEATTYHDDVSKSQNENLNRIVDFHNSKSRDLDVSVHFNAYVETDNPMGTETLYVTQGALAADVALLVSKAGHLINRGGKKRTDLFFLNNTDKPAVLIEVCFVDSQADADLYGEYFDQICEAIATALSGGQGVMLPPEEIEKPPLPTPPPPARPTLAKGDAGDDVAYLQEQLNSDFDAGLTVDGDFGSRTDSAVRGYQASRNLASDGIVGANTWNALETNAPPYVPPGLPEPLSVDDQNGITAIAINSEIAGYKWKDRGIAPDGYIEGFALAFANVCRKLDVDHAPSIEMAKANSGNPERDVLEWYKPEFDKLGMNNSSSGPDTLRHLFALMLGLGMRESSGQHCVGRDMSADNTSSETAEAGLFQTSWNAHNASSAFDQLFDEYATGGVANDHPQGFLPWFADGVYCDGSNWDNYGSGDGYRFQKMAKGQPAFAVETAAITLRNLRQHYGPIGRKEAELRPEADEMLRAVQQYLDDVAEVVA